MKTTAPSHIAKIRQLSATDAEQIQLLLHWSHEEYTGFQFEEYCAFVECISEGYPRIQNEILYSPVFRGFWNNEWSRRDKEEFLDFAPDSGLPTDVLETEYRFVHSHERLLEEDAFMIRYCQILKLI